MMQKPQAPTPLWNTIPTELIQCDHWVCWCYEWKEGRWTKVPYCSNSKYRASTTEPSHWSSFAEAKKRYEKGAVDGVGFVFTPDNSYTGIDMDHCIDDDGEISEAAKEVIARFGSYCEISPSGRGIKIWCRGDVFPSLGENGKGEPKRGSKRGDYEAYSAKRFFTVTGHTLTSDAIIANAQEAIDWFVKTYLMAPPPKKPKVTIPPTRNSNPPGDSADIWKAIRKSAQAERIDRLMKGDIAGYEHDDSRADMALLCMLAFWFGPDPARLEHEFTQSKLADRDKWKTRTDYRQQSIAKALTLQTQFYSQRTSQQQPKPSTLQSSAAERAVLACILQQPQCLDDVRLTLQADDFYFDDHRRVYEGLCELADTQGVSSLDDVTVAAHLDMSLDRLHALLTSDKIHREVAQYVRVIRRFAERRAIVATGEWMIEEARRPQDSELLLDEAENRVLGIRDRRRSSHVITLGEASHLVLDRVEALTAGTIIGLSTHLPQLDTLVALRPQDLVICAARPGVGKSIVGGQVALGNALAGKSVFIASVEMAREDIAGRMMSLHSSIDSSVTGARRVPSLQESHLLNQASTELYGLHIRIDDSASQTLPLISANARRIQRQHGLDLVVVDYLQLVQCIRQRGQTRAEVIGELSRGLKRLAKELNIPILALAQLNRQSEYKGEPELHHIRESGDIEQDADQVWLMWNNAEDDELVHIKVAKHRGGPCGTVMVRHDKRFMRFVPHNAVYFGGRGLAS